MIRKFRAGTGDATEDAEQKVFTTKAETLDGIARAARKAPGIEGQAGQMHIEYVTTNGHKVLHQLREVDTMASAVKRLEATGFARTGRMGDLEWSDGYTDAHIRFGSPDGARAPIARFVHEYSILN